MQPKNNHIIYILLGSNLGNRNQNLTNAILEIEENIGKVKVASSVYSTAPWGFTDQPEFLNQVIKIESKLIPSELILKILSAEKKLGRTKTEKWKERLIDIDILFYDDEIIEVENLIIPHPQLHNRKFTLVPLFEIAPDLIHPLLNKSIQELLQICEDDGEVKRI